MADAAVRMVIRQTADQMTSFGIDPLINGFMTKDGAPLCFSEFAGNDFRGPFKPEPGFDLAFEGFSFEPFFTAAMLQPGSGDKLGMERVVMQPCEVTPEFAGQRGVMASQGSSYGPQRLSAFQERCEDLPFFFVEMCVGFHRPPF